MKESCTAEEFAKLFQEHGAEGAAKILGVNVRAVYARRRRIEDAKDAPIASPNVYTREYPVRIPLTVDTGTVLVASDGHIWPGPLTTAQRGFICLAKELQPKAILANGDFHDGARSGRHPPLGWSRKPTTNEELTALDIFMDHLRAAAGNRADLLWLLGNHDRRFEAKLAAQTPENEGVPGFSLKDHYPHWRFGVSTWINNDVVVKHRFKGGIHATHNNTLWAGKNIVTGHLHSLKVTPFNDYNGLENGNRYARTRWGVDTGTLADPYDDQFDYGEDCPLNHRSGFVVLTFHKGVLLWPELAAVVNEKQIQFRGQLIDV